MGFKVFDHMDVDTTYYFRARSRRPGGTWGAWKPVRGVSVTTDKAPVIPSPDSITGGFVAAWPFYILNAILIFWTKVDRPDLKAYRVYRTTTTDTPKESDMIAELLGTFYIDTSFDLAGVAKDGTGGNTLVDVAGTFNQGMVGERVWNTNDIDAPLYASIDAVSADGTTITTDISRFDDEGDQYTIDFKPWKEQLYYYWIKCIGRDETPDSAFSEPDGAELGKPDTVDIIGAGEQDTASSIFMFLGWKVSWSSDSGAEGYWLKYKLGNGLYSIPIYVPHIGVPSYEQAYVFPWCLVNQFYTFAVQPVNGLFASQTWGDISTLTTFVEDNQAPDPPAEDTMDIVPGFWSNLLSWHAPSGEDNLDIAQFFIYRNQNDDNPDNATHVGTAGFAQVVAWTDPFGGEIDLADNRYWITSVDHTGNESIKSTMLQETNPTPTRTPGGVNLFWLVLVWWAANDGDLSYKVYRSKDAVAKGGFEIDDDKNLLIENYGPILLFDGGDEPTRKAAKPPFLLPTPTPGVEYYYKVVAKTFNQNLAVASTSTGGITPIIPDDDDLPPRSMSKLLLDYDEIRLKAGIIDIEADIATIDARIINLDADGNIKLTAGGAIILDGGVIYIRAARGIQIGSEGDISFYDNDNEETGALRSFGAGIGLFANAGNTLYLNSGSDISMSSQTGFRLNASRNIDLKTSNEANSQFRVKLPLNLTSSAGYDRSTKILWELYVDGDQNVKAKYISP
jgi:hypothetical protein